MSIMEKVKGIGAGIGGITLLVAFGAIIAMAFLGSAWVSLRVSPWLMPTFFVTLAVCLLVLGPTAFFRNTRGFSATGFLVASYIFGVILWVWALLLTLELWGMLAAVIGLLIMGVGIVPVAILAAIFHSQWSSLADIVILLFSTFGIRVFSIWLASKADRVESRDYF